MDVREIVNFLNERIESTEKKQSEDIANLNRTHEKMLEGKIQAYNDVLNFVLNSPKKRH